MSPSNVVAARFRKSHLPDSDGTRNINHQLIPQVAPRVPGLIAVLRCDVDALDDAVLGEVAVFWRLERQLDVVFIIGVNGGDDKHDVFVSCAVVVVLLNVDR